MENTRQSRTGALLLSTVVGFLLSAGCVPARPAEGNAVTVEGSSTARTSVEKVLRSYETALNESDVQSIVPLYTETGVFMAQHRTPTVGRSAIADTYEEIFGAIKLDVRFHIDEIVLVSESVAYARTRSAGTVSVIGRDLEMKESNQELFILERNDGENWLISRYIFSTTNPPPLSGD